MAIRKQCCGKMKCLHAALFFVFAVQAQPALAQDAIDPPGINNAQLMLIVERIERHYPLPIDPQAIHAVLSERGIELAGQNPDRVAECNQLEERERRRLTFSMAVVRATMCAVEGLEEEARGPVLRQLAEALLGQLHGPNMLLDLNEDGQIDTSADSDPSTGLVTQRIGDVLILRPEDMPVGIARDLRDAADAADAQAILIDLRGNEGGGLDDVVAIADGFLAEGEIVRVEGKRLRDTLVYTADEAEVAVGMPLGVLVDEGSSSGAEMIAAALQDHGRATVIGRHTLGSAAIRTLLPLSRRLAIVLVTGVVYRPSGEMIDGTGVTPDCRLEPTADGFLERAAAIVIGMETCPPVD